MQLLLLLKPHRGATLQGAMPQMLLLLLLLLPLPLVLSRWREQRRPIGDASLAELKR